MTQLQRILLLQYIVESLREFDYKADFTEEELVTAEKIAVREVDAITDNDDEFAEFLRMMSREIYAELIKAEAFL